MLSVRFGWLMGLGALLVAPAVHAQNEARDRQAAAEAYDKGTSAYVAQDYEGAAQWFETANRLSPAAPALIQAARSHQQAGHLTRAATLALQLVQTYPDDSNATSIGEGLLTELAPRFVRVDVDCTDCALDVDGDLMAAHSFFVEPDSEHTVTASFETGEQRQTISGSAGETKSLEFEAPPPRPESGEPPFDGPRDSPEVERKPLSPVITYVGIGLTAALLAGTIGSGLDTISGVDAYEDAARDWRAKCQDKVPPPSETMACEAMRLDARDKLDKGEDKETRTNILMGVTGVVGVATLIVALTLTDWSGEPESDEAAGRRLSLAVGADHHGAALSLKGSF